MKDFEIHTRLSKDSIFVIDLTLSRMMLMNDARFPWLILIPRKTDISELYELSSSDQTTLLSETIKVSQILKNMTHADKMNIATLGNIVPQLHIHIIARKKEDSAWPAPVWGHGSPEHYVPEIAEKLILSFKQSFNAHFN